VADFRNEGPREQHNYGSGPFIGGNNYAPIRYETLDPKTRMALAKLSTDAPELAELLKRSFREGIISPDIVDALVSAVRNINEDVAESLRFAGQNINEDVAESLRFAGQNINEDVAESLRFAGQNINSEVADRITRAADRVDEAMRGLDYALPSLNNTAERIERVITPPPPEIIVNRMVTFKAFLCGVAVGALALLILFLAKPF
jgi:hypothetical protein